MCLLLSKEEFEKIFGSEITSGYNTLTAPVSIIDAMLLLNEIPNALICLYDSTKQAIKDTLTKNGSSIASIKIMDDPDNPNLGNAWKNEEILIIDIKKNIFFSTQTAMVIGIFRPSA